MSVGVIGAYFDARADEWDQISEPAGAKHLAVAHLAGVCEGARVLDIGCGTGIMESAYIELGAAEIVALDMSDKMIAHARERFTDVPQTRLRFECTDAIDFAHETQGAFDAHFDAVVIYNAYPHIKRKSELVIAACNLLKSGGRFLVAHGMGRNLLNDHHANVPEEVTSELRSVEEESRIWENKFDIDMAADTSHIYFFGGKKR